MCQTGFLTSSCCIYCWRRTTVLTVLELYYDRIDLWLVFLGETFDEKLLAGYRSLLTADVQFQQSCFYFEADRHRYLVTRIGAHCAVAIFHNEAARLGVHKEFLWTAANCERGWLCSENFIQYFPHQGSHSTRSHTQDGAGC